VESVVTGQMGPAPKNITVLDSVNENGSPRVYGTTGLNTPRVVDGSVLSGVLVAGGNVSPNNPL